VSGPYTQKTTFLYHPSRAKNFPFLKNYSPEEQAILQLLDSGLSQDLYYHGFHHTMDVLQAALQIASGEDLTPDEIKLLRIAVLYHDAGFMKTYKDHEESGCDIAKNNLPAFGYTNEQIDTICGMIRATKIPQKPHNILEEIICDADLDYLGRDDFDKISNTLYEEMKKYVHVHDEKEWYQIQKKFLENHHYFTKFGKERREPVKQMHLNKINQIIEQLA
jgi:uncharacterized protein